MGLRGRIWTNSSAERSNGSCNGDDEPFRDFFEYPFTARASPITDILDPFLLLSRVPLPDTPFECLLCPVTVELSFSSLSEGNSNTSRVVRNLLFDNSSRGGLRFFLFLFSLFSSPRGLEALCRLATILFSQVSGFEFALSFIAHRISRFD